MWAVAPPPGEGSHFEGSHLEHVSNVFPMLPSKVTLNPRYRKYGWITIMDRLNPKP